MSNRRKIKTCRARPDRLQGGTVARIRDRYDAGRAVEWSPALAGAALAAVPELVSGELFVTESAKICREFRISSEDLMTIAGPDLLAAAAVSAYLNDRDILTRQAGRIRRVLYDASVRELLTAESAVPA